MSPIGPIRPIGLIFILAAAAFAADLARFEIKEPLGHDWRDEWLTRQVQVDLGERPLRLSSLQLKTADGELLPAQFDAEGKAVLRVLFKASLKKDETKAFVVTDDGNFPPPWPSVQVENRRLLSENGGLSLISIENGSYHVIVGMEPHGSLYIVAGSRREPLFHWVWPKGAEPSAARHEWVEKGPARAILKRTFTFRNPEHRYGITFDFRAGDPWIDITEDYSLGRGSSIKVDLAGLNADTVYHPHTYNARTFKPDGKAEDTTLEPPQHPIATLGPIWRDIWFGGGPFAFVYRSDADCGIGFAAVRGSEWTTPDGITPESQNLEVHGDKEKPAKVWVKLPTDGGHRRWAIVVGPPDLRKKMGEMVRSHADIPLDKVLHDWVLDWKSDAPAHSFGMAGAWFGPYNRHELNPTTFPRRVGSHLNALMKKGENVKSRDLAFLAYVFTDPNYWPGPKYKWAIGNPNFHTDMYNIPLKIGLLMPDHPHAKRWVDYGVEETKGNLMRDSFPRGAWAESLSYSGFFFHVVENARMLRDAGVCEPFRDWPRFKEVATYLACMHTPVDPRYGERQIAPIGDTSPGNYAKPLNEMAKLYTGINETFAQQLMMFPDGTWKAPLDLRSRELYGFGAMLRGNPYDDRHESFVTVKAGPARNHFQGDELSFHFCSLAAPLAIDYACHYSPRPWSASMHNRPDMAGLRPVAVGVRRAFAASEAADVFVADERTRTISHLPLEPHHTDKPGWEYPTTTLDKPWTMRRYAMLVKHDPTRSQIADYLVLRDEIDSPEPPWWNLHVLARDMLPDGQRFGFPGQLGVDLTAHFLAPAVGEIEKRQWGWSIERTNGTRRNLKGEAYEKEHFGHVIPKDFLRGTWGKSFEQSGEMARWLRVKGGAGRTNWLVVLVPNLQGKPAPRVEKLSDTSARVTLGEETEVIHLGSDGKFQAAVERGDRQAVLLKAGEVKPWGELDFKPTPAPLDQGAR